MPRSKPDEVIVHRIEFNNRERDLLEGALTAYQVNKVMTPAVALLSDGSALYALGVIYEIVTGRDIPGIVNPMEAEQFWDAVKDEVRSRESVEVREERATSFVGGLQNILDFIGSTLPGGDVMENVTSWKERGTGPSFEGIGGEHPDR
jgi:hypothetical protein